MNAGGASTVVEPILGYFTGGTLGYYVYQDEQRPFSVPANDVNGSQQLPLVVLVGSGSASYGEIFAGVLQDAGRAHIIGTTTDGNVEVLWGYSFDDGSELWLASETFRPARHPDLDWEATGIIPDETVPGDFDQTTLENDPPVIAALAYFEALP
jgi:carboxyl-terminal processing protease